MKKIRLDRISADPPAGMTKDKASKRFEALGEELFGLQDQLFGAKLASVLVVRVHQLVPEKLWQERYQHIADFEELRAEHGTLILKFFLHITKEEQEKRLLEREEDPKAAWKLNPKDWQERAHWDAYTEAYEEAIARTHTAHAPWIVVPANKKWYRNLVVAESIVAALRPHRKGWAEKLEATGKAGRAQLEAYRRQEKLNSAP